MQKFVQRDSGTVLDGSSLYVFTFRFEPSGLFPNQLGVGVVGEWEGVRGVGGGEWD